VTPTGGDRRPRPTTVLGRTAAGALVAVLLLSLLVLPAAATGGVRTASAAAAAAAAPGVAPAVVPSVVPRSAPAYWLVDDDGAVSSFGGLPAFGSMADRYLRSPVVAMAPTAGEAGYWLADGAGDVYAFGDAVFHGSAAALHLDQPVVGMAATPDDGGYWLVAGDGGVFTYGDAAFYGSAVGVSPGGPVVAMAPTADGGGYWLVTARGQVLSFGDAVFHGSAAGLAPGDDISSIAPTPDGGGYWLVAASGRVLPFGDAPYFGSADGVPPDHPAVGLAATPDGGGYWVATAGGGVLAFGDAPADGSSTDAPGYPVVGIALGSKIDQTITPAPAPASAVVGSTPFTPTATASSGLPVTITLDPSSGSACSLSGGTVSFTYIGTCTIDYDQPGDANYQPAAEVRQSITVVFPPDPSYASGSYGYDISNWQCSSLPQGPHPIGIVEVTGESFGYANPCLATEAAWAGGGLNLYMFLTFGQLATGPPVCAGNTACNAGYAAAQQAFGQARQALVDTQVTWWLDVERPPASYPQWSSDLAVNAAYVQGAVDGLQADGVPTVGFYTSVLTWSSIVGTGYQPELPLWLAWYTGDPVGNCRTALSYAEANGVTLPTGPVWLTQYTDDADGYDGDYAC